MEKVALTDSAEHTFHLDMTRLTDSDKRQLEALRAQYSTIDAMRAHKSLFYTPEEHMLIGSTVPCMGAYPTVPIALMLFPGELNTVNQVRAEIKKVSVYASRLKLFSGAPSHPEGDFDIVDIEIGAFDPTSEMTAVPHYEGVPLDVVAFRTNEDEQYQESIASANEREKEYAQKANDAESLKSTQQTIAYLTANRHLFAQYYRNPA
jgi:hypothetical protein